MAKSPSKFLTAIVILQAGVIVGLIAGNLRAPGLESTAHAQIADPAAQQMQTNELLKGIDAKLTRIVTAVEGELRVRATQPPAPPSSAK